MHREIINGIVILMALGALAQWLAWRLKFPSILILLTVGFVAGPVTGVFRPEHVLGPLTFPFVSLAAAVVLFEGGLSASWEEMRHVATPVRRLIAIGIPITWSTLTVAGHYLLGLQWELALLLGAILVVTGPTVIGPLLRHSRPRGSVASVLKLEGIINDPIGAILAVLVFQGIRAEEIDRAFTVVGAGILKAIVLGGALGIAGAFFYVQFREKKLLPEFLHNAVLLPFMLVVYAAANYFQQESGLLAVTIMGIALASQQRVDIEGSLEFTEHARVLLISTLFILLTARMELEDIVGLPATALGFVVIVIFVARPACVWLSTFGSGLSGRERFFLSAVAPRGVVAAAVSSLFALELTDGGYPGASILMPVTFVVIASTVFTSGISASPLVRRLGLARTEPQGVVILGANPVARLFATAIRERGFQVTLVDSDRARVEEARAEGLCAEKGEILSRRVLSRLDVGDIGHFVALTPNDDINTLAAARFRKIIGAQNVHQTHPSSELGHAEPEYADELQAHHVAGGKTFDGLAALIKGGAVVNATPIRSSDAMKEIRDRYGQDAVALFAVCDEGRRLAFIDTDDQLPGSGELVVLTPP
ncbi:MAG: cation:proton antiporter [Myxococcales bacterium]